MRDVQDPLLAEHVAVSSNARVSNRRQHVFENVVSVIFGVFEFWLDFVSPQERRDHVDAQLPSYFC